MSKKEDKQEPKKEVVHSVPQSRVNATVQRLGMLKLDLNDHTTIQSAINYLITGK